MRVVRRPETRAKVGLCNSAIDQKEERGEFPRRIRLGLVELSDGSSMSWISGSPIE
jgi:predicted DNA-binding transcriptional regulator AlpA